MVDPFSKLFGDALLSIEKSGATSNGVGDMIVQCRKLLEHTKSKNKFPTANLFGNWAVHSELHKTADILEEINSFLSKLLTGSGGGPFGPEISSKFRLGDLRADYLRICEEIGVANDVLQNDDSWADIRDMVLNKICESKLSADSREIERLALLHPECTYVVTGAMITKDPSVLQRVAHDRPSKLRSWWIWPRNLIYRQRRG